MKRLMVLVVLFSAVLMLASVSFAGIGPIEIVPVDVKPQSCPNPLNLRSKGVLPVAILGTEDFDVTMIDPASIRLVFTNGLAVVPPVASPLRWSYEDVATPVDVTNGINGTCPVHECTEEGPDGFMDLTLKFNKQQILGPIGGPLGVDASICLSLLGTLLDGTPISGYDVVVIPGSQNGFPVD